MDTSSEELSEAKFLESDAVTEGNRGAVARF